MSKNLIVELKASEIFLYAGTLAYAQLAIEKISNGAEAHEFDLQLLDKVSDSLSEIQDKLLSSIDSEV